jgi:hypothetical protein
MPFPILFSLTRFAPRMRKQEGDVLAFGEDAVVVIKRGEELHRFLYSDLQRLRYFHFPVTFSRTFQFMSGGLFQKREARFRIKINDRWHEFWLETDLEFRTAELTELFGELYAMSVPLEEFSHSGVRLRLLETTG